MDFYEGIKESVYLEDGIIKWTFGKLTMIGMYGFLGKNSLEEVMLPEGCKRGEIERGGVVELLPGVYLNPGIEISLLNYASNGETALITSSFDGARLKQISEKIIECADITVINPEAEFLEYVELVKATEKECYLLFRSKGNI